MPTTSKILLCFSCVSLLFTAHVRSSHPDIDPLLSFKQSISHDPLARLSNWNPESLTPCTWTGISCSSSTSPHSKDRVVGIDLSHGNLQGSISAHLGNLSYLQVFNLSFNELSGNIASSLGMLREIKHILLKSNRLSGTIPTSLGCNCKLVELDLSRNSLTGSIPAALLNCSDLELLSLAQNNIYGKIPAQIGSSLPKLLNLSLDHNKLTGGIPASIGKLARIVQLGLSENRLSGIVEPFLLNCKELQILKLAINCFSGPLPADIGNALPKLQNLSAYGNQLTGSIPASLGNCSKLIKVDLANNRLEGSIPPSLTNCPALLELKLSSNRISGKIPEDLGIRLRRLIIVKASKNRLTGRIPDSIGNASALELLDLSENRLDGAIPVSLGRLSKLQFLWLDENLLTSGVNSSDEVIPLLEAFNGSNRLSSLHLRGNRLTGTLPFDMGYRFRHLQNLDISSNGIGGIIPASLGNLSALRILDLSGNNFSGTIPSELGALKHLQQLNLRDNKLQGQIPKELGLGNRALSSLYLCGNQLSGPIPASIGDLPRLADLFLNNNNLSGEIPSDFGKCAALGKLDLSHNRLSGGLRSQLMEQLNVCYLNISFNNVSGQPPDSVGRNLKVADLSHNRFTGNVPKWAYLIASANFSENSLTGMSDCEIEFDHGSNQQSRIPSSCRGGDTTEKSSKQRLLVACICGGFSVLFILGLITVLVYRYTRKPPSNAEKSWRNERFIFVSERELLKATDNQSASNLLGRGSHGEVYRGVLSSGMTVAVKIFRAAQEEETEQMFLRECEILKQIRHRNLVKIITACSSERIKALIMQYMANGSLHDLLHSPREEEGRLMPLSLSTRLRLLREIASALAYLHHDCTPSVVHCDLKPQNVLLDEEMTTHISDFGMARIAGQSDISATLNLEGSIGYIAPEYGVGAQASSKGDVYSFGVVTLETMTRMRPTDPILSSAVTFSAWVSTALEKGFENCRKVMINERKGQKELQKMSEEEYRVFEEMLKLGVWCSSESPERRPTMRKVEGQLALLSDFYRQHNSIDSSQEILFGHRRSLEI